MSPRELFFVLTAHTEVTDRMLILGERHLRYMLDAHVGRYNGWLPHQGITNARPVAPLPEPITDPDRIAHLNIHRRDHLGGVLHEYEHAA